MQYNSMITLDILRHFQPHTIDEAALLTQLRDAFSDDEISIAYDVWELATMINDAAAMIADVEAARVDVPAARRLPGWMGGAMMLVSFFATLSPLMVL